jgi:hypothetical protein
MAGSFHDLNANITQQDFVAVFQGQRFEFSSGTSAQADLGTCLVAEFDVAGEKIGVKVRQKDEADGVSGCGGIIKVLLDIALWIHNSSSFGAFISNQV